MSPSPPLASLQSSTIGAHKTTFNKRELEELWAFANPGFGNPHLMAAIALAESSGNSQSVNEIGACGLWQIHPYESGCLDPVTNAKQAGAKLRSQGLKAWTTYTSGAYLKYLGSSTEPSAYTASGTRRNVSVGGFLEKLVKPPWEEQNQVKPGELGAPFSTIEKGFEAFKSAGEVFSFIFSEQGEIRILKVLGGAILIGIAVIELAKVGTGGEADVSSAVTRHTAGTVYSNIT